MAGNYSTEAPQYQIIDRAPGVIVDGPNHEVILRRDGQFTYHQREPVTPIQAWPSTQIPPHVATEAVTSLLLLRQLDDAWRDWAQTENERLSKRPTDPAVPLPSFVTTPSPLEPVATYERERTEVTIRGRDTYLILVSDGTVAWRWAPGALDTSLQPITVTGEHEKLFQECVRSAVRTISSYISNLKYRREHPA